MKLSANALAHAAGGVLPSVALRSLLSASLDGLDCALCLHRMEDRKRPTDWQQGLNMPPSELDALLQLLLGARPRARRGWLTVSFDDGYADSAEYIRSRARRFPEVQFLFFVCPEKLEQRAGFRWDLAERALVAGQGVAAAQAVCDAPVEVATENARPDLLALGGAPEFQLATIDEVRALTRFPNVALGNHTNTHVSAVQLSDDQAREDYRRSTERFTGLFGPPAHFAFPFGTPVHHFGPRHVEMLRALGDFVIWTTEARPLRFEERAPRAVLPRFPVDGSRTAGELAGWIAARSVDFKLRGRKRA